MYCSEPGRPLTSNERAYQIPRGLSSALWYSELVLMELDVAQAAGA